MITLCKKTKNKQNYSNTFSKKTPLEIPKPPSQKCWHHSLSSSFFSLYKFQTQPTNCSKKHRYSTSFSFHFLSLLIFSLSLSLFDQFKNFFPWLAFNNTTSSPLISCTLVHNHNKLLLNPLFFLSKPLILKNTLNTNNHLGPMPPLLLLLLFTLKTTNLFLLLTTRSPNSPQTLFLGCFGSLKMNKKMSQTLLESTKFLSF